MKGQIITRAGKKGRKSWLVRIFLGRDPKTGKRKYHHHTVKTSAADAEKYRRAVLRELDTGTYIETTSLTVDAYLDEWMRSAVLPRVEYASYESYAATLKSYVRPFIGSRRVADLRAIDIQSAFAELLERGISPNTIKKAHSVLASALRQAVKWRLITQNVAQLVDLPKQRRKEMMALTPDEAERLLEAAKGKRYFALIAFAIFTGMRPSEYFALKWSDLDLKNKTVTVRRKVAWKKKGGGWYLGEPKTDKSRRTIPITDELVRVLAEHKKLMMSERLKAGAEYVNHDFIFPNTQGGAIHFSDFTSRVFKPLLERAEISREFRLYDLRHSCATLLLAAGENAKVISERLGHARISTTLDVYAHVLPSMQIEASNKLDQLLFKKA